MGEGAPPPPPGKLGLRRFEILVSSSDELEAVEKRLRGAGHEVSADAGAIAAVDPSGNQVRVAVGCVDALRE